MLKKLKIILFLFFGSLFSACYGQTTISEEVKNNIKSRVDNGINTGIVVGIIDTDGTQYYSYGVKSLKTNEPVDEHSVFEIGSISKTFTGIILADMVLKKEVKLTDPLQGYLPEGTTAPTRDDEFIQLVHMSNHTSSLPRLPNNFAPANPANPYADYSEEQLYDCLNGYQLKRDIGSEYEYSNYAAGLLGHILAAKRGLTYEQMMIDVIAKPLDLKNTRIAFTPSMKKNLALGHSGGVEVENWDLPTLAGAGAIRSTAFDMLKYIEANMGRHKNKLYSAMQLSHKNSMVEGSKPMVGLGWHIMSADGLEIIWHNGGTGGYRTFTGFINGGDKGVVVLSNSNASVDDIGIHLLNPKSDLKVIEPLPKEIVVNDIVLESYIGKYELMPRFILTISKDGSQLTAQATGQPEVPVFAKSDNVFFYKVVEAKLTFNKNDNGDVESVTLHQAGQKLVGKRLEN